MGMYLVTNITDQSLDPKDVYIGDLPNRHVVTISPGSTVDLEVFSTRNQILDSIHLKVLLVEGKITVDTLGTDPRERIFVDAEVSGIDIGDVTISGPIPIEVQIDGSGELVSGSSYQGSQGIDVFPIFPQNPTLQNILIPIANIITPITLPIDSKRFLVKARERFAGIELSFTPGMAQTITFGRGAAFVEENVEASSLTFYVRTNLGPTTIEVLSWSYAP